jgi:cytochrome c oxidase subunit 2
MTILLGTLCLILLVIVIVQLGKVSELTSSIRGEEDAQRRSDYWNSRLGVVFMVVFLAATLISSWYYKNYMLGFGPHESASEHGFGVDTMFAITLFFTGVVFIITHILLFWFAYKYRYDEQRSAVFNPHDNRLEIIWTIIPAIVMTILVVYGLDTWNTVMSDVGPEDDFMEIEATGMQFAWILRYPGEDGELGARDYRRITGINPLGQIWTDKANLDDFQPNDLVLPVDKKVRVRITSRDVLHNFYLPHFRVKMDAVPGMPTYFVFTPTKTTEEYRQELSKYKEYQEPSDPNDPESPAKWEVFDYELACAELCGRGHFSMKKIVKVLPQDEYEEWVKTQNSYYLSSVRGSDDDPFAGELLGFEIEQSLEGILSSIDSMGMMNAEALDSLTAEDKTLALDVGQLFAGEETSLTDVAKEELDQLVEGLKTTSGAMLKLESGEDAPQNKSFERANAIKNYLMQNGIDSSRIKIGIEQPEEGVEI